MAAYRKASEMAPALLGLDIGGTKTALVLGDTNGQILRRLEVPTPVTEPFEAAIGMIAAAAEGLMVECKVEGLGVPEAISVSVGGPLDIARGILVMPPQLADWGEAPLKAQLEEMFGLPVYVEQDANAGALAEYTFGAGRGSRNLVFLAMETGLRAGLILNGQIYHGASDTAGEVGHLRVAEDGPLQHGKAGAWESYGSGAGLVSLARWMHPGLWPQDLTPRDVVSRALQGDPAARALVEEAGRGLGRGLAVLIDVLNPDVIVVGTLGVLLGDLLLEPARAVVRAEALPRAVAACRIVPADLGESLGDVAALMAGIVAMRKGA